MWHVIVHISVVSLWVTLYKWFGYLCLDNFMIAGMNNAVCCAVDTSIKLGVILS